MKKTNVPITLKNIKNNLFFLCSAIAALCLFLMPSFITFMIIVAAFIAIIIFAGLGIAKPTESPTGYLRVVSIALTFLVIFMGFYTFRTAWISSNKIVVLADALNMTPHNLILVIGMFFCLVGFYATYILSIWIVSWSAETLKEQLPVWEKTEMIANLKRNWYFVISAMSFFCLAIFNSLGYYIGLPIAFIIMIIIAGQFSSMWTFVKQHTVGEKIFFFVNAVGICLGNQASFYEKTLKLTSQLQLHETFNKLFLFISYFATVAALFFVFFCLLIFWKEIKRILLGSNLADNVTLKECFIYGLLIVASIGTMAYIFTQSVAFYGTEFSYDIIYTSDSPAFIKRSVYLVLAHPENDLRQPLFAVFAAPFMGIPYLITRLIGGSVCVQAIVINSVQIIMLFAANFMLTKMMKLDLLKRICFMVLVSCTYTHLLFTLMIEQYIVAYFWLIFCIYLIVGKQQPNRLVLWGAGGTLMTSIILLPFATNKSPIRNTKEWFVDMIKYAFEFVALMLIFCRFEVIFNLMRKISFLSGFTGKSVAFTERIYQYTTFISNCFFAPNAGANTTAVNHISWQLQPSTCINYIGVIIMILAVFSAIWNRDKKSSILSVCWIAFSVFLLFILGWGTKENGLILYSLYFGWAFFVLLFQLVEKIENKLNIKFILPAITVCTVVALLIINVPAVMEMVNFAILNYPA